MHWSDAPWLAYLALVCWGSAWIWSLRHDVFPGEMPRGPGFAERVALAALAHHPETACDMCNAPGPDRIRMVDGQGLLICQRCDWEE